ncbi:MAG: DNA polymerase III subunit delta [Nitrospirae bacterium]|nr:DNA polymerase III subunit delta [Nitrospirota bacterium]
MSIRHFIQELEKGLRAPVYFLYADDPYLLKEASLIGERTVPEGERDFSVTVFDLDGIDKVPPFAQIVDVINTVPFMGRRTVIIENIQELSRKDMGPLENYLSDPSPYALLILLHMGSPKAQFKDVIKKAKSVSLDIRPQELPLWIKEKARQKGFELTQDAVEYLLGITGADVGLLSAELEKFSFIGKSRLDTGDIRGVVKGNSDFDAFDLVNALRERNPEKVFKVARALQETQESYSLLGALNWHYSRLFSKERRGDERYRRVFELLSEADAGIKTSGGTFPLEYLLVKLLRI